jgi:hypothetical protein
VVEALHPARARFDLGALLVPRADELRLALLLDLPIGARTMKRPRTKNVRDPLLEACSACKAGVGEPCKSVDKDGAPLALAPRASRLVHAARLEHGDPP